MHLIIPYAASQALAAPDVLSGLSLPRLQTLLGQLVCTQREHDTEGAAEPHLPHERALARALGWDLTPALPWAAWSQAQAGQANPQPQAWITPCHWQVGMDQVLMHDPARLQLSDEESQQLLHAMQPFLKEDGLQVTWHSALTWHAQGDMLADLPTASLDRVIGANVKHWMPESAAARPLRRLQSEMQMLLYNHPVNDAREARRQPTVNSFWLHGAGVLPAQTPTDAPALLADGLRAAALQGHAQAWQAAWQELDATVLAAALTQLQSHGALRLTLCSEHAAHTYEAQPQAWHQRILRPFRKTPAHAALQALITP
jgi:hypothetical protein